MPTAERLGGRSRCWDSRTGFWFDESGEWRPEHWDLAVLQDRMNRAWFGKATPTPVPDLHEQIKRLVGDAAEASLGGFRQRFMAGSLPVTINERSKPMGLNKAHEYKDAAISRDTVLHVEPNHSYGIAEGAVAYVFTEGGGSARNAGVYVSKADSVPLALNALGEDRPAADDFAPISAVVVGGEGHRENVLAHAVASLRAVDLYDQRQAAKKSEAEAQAKRDAEAAENKQMSFNFAKIAYANAIRDQIANGISGESAAKVQAALSAYETARRKLEGLPA